MSEEPGHGRPQRVPEGIPAGQLVVGPAVGAPVLGSLVVGTPADGSSVHSPVVGSPVGGSSVAFNVLGVPILGAPGVPAVPEDVHPWWAEIKTVLAKLRTLCSTVCCVFVVLFIVFFVGLLLLYRCSTAPVIALKEFTIRDMVVFHDTATNSTLWQVTSDVTLALSTRNRNTLAGCSTRLRRMEVSVFYKTSVILASDIPEGQFSLMPKKSRPVPAELMGERFELNDQVGRVLEAELLNDNITLRLEIHTRYLTSVRKSHWTVTTCEVVAMTPLTSFSRLGTLLTKNCNQQSVTDF